MPNVYIQAVRLMHKQPYDRYVRLWCVLPDEDGELQERTLLCFYTQGFPDPQFTQTRPGMDLNLAWWEAVRRMPHCRLWTETDWRFAIETARLVEEFWRGELGRAAELRLRSAKLGLTHEDRLKLRIRYVEPVDESAASAADPAAVTRLDERRKRLSGAP